MTDETTPAPAPAPRAAASPVPVPRRVPPRPTSPRVATGPGQAAGHAIASLPRPPALPPGIPASLAGHINTTGGAPAAAPVEHAPERHAMFAPRSQERVALDRQLHQLRQQLVNAVAVGEGTIAIINTSIDLMKDAPPSVLEAEGIDLGRLVKFRAAIEAAIALANP